MSTLHVTGMLLCQYCSFFYYFKLTDWNGSTMDLNHTALVGLQVAVV